MVFRADPSTVNAGQTTGLSWSVMLTSAYFCNLAGDGATKRVQLRTSYYETQPLATTTTFTLTCTGLNNTQVSKSAMVTVATPLLRPAAVEGSVTAPAPTQTTSASLSTDAPPAPTGFTATAGVCGSYQITLGWKKPAVGYTSPLVGYSIYRTGGSNPHTISVTDPGLLSAVDFGSSAYPSFIPGAVYSYQITARYSDGTASVPTDPISVTTPSACL